ncbi:hypothetical protein [Peristeroidobacter soli]|uniref:hypothetical protein n=1 Tax=Peristeroidobacter soli TaxID=2497877 RepID=UPI00101D9949|nr:hypothetical protein [Peristeroidobacter soli]
MCDLKVGDTVVFVDAPDGLLKDLPSDEQNEILSFVGKPATITSVDEFGYVWIGFGSQVDDGDESHYSGHSFAVTADCLRQATR